MMNRVSIRDRRRAVAIGLGQTSFPQYLQGIPVSSETARRARLRRERRQFLGLVLITLTTHVKNTPRCGGLHVAHQNNIRLSRPS